MTHDLTPKQAALANGVSEELYDRVVNPLALTRGGKVRLFVEAVWNEGRLELIDELVAADYIGHVPCSEAAVIGPEGVRQLVASRRRLCPGLYIKIEDQIAEDDRVVTRWQATTTEPQAQPVSAPAARTPRQAGISIIRLLAGKQVDSRTEYTSLASNGPAGPAKTCP